MLLVDKSFFKCCINEMNNKIDIFYIQHTQELIDAVFQRQLVGLPQIFQNEINAYKHMESAQASLLGKLLLKHAFQNLQVQYSLHDVVIGRKDRPMLNDALDFNISHSGEFVICAIAQDAKVGIDIEKHRNINIELFKKYFNDEEWNEIKTAKNQNLSFFDMWSLKESAIKCDGRGVEILSKTHKQYTATDEHQIVCDDVLFHYKKLQIVEQYSAFVCSNMPFSLKITNLHYADLFSS